MDNLGLSKDEIKDLFKKTKGDTRHDIKMAENIFRMKANYEAAVKAEADELLKKQQEKEALEMKREEEEKQTIMNLQICKKYTDGATIKSLKDEYNVTKPYLNKIFKKYIRKSFS